jgi:hypothetical protein
MSPAASVHPFTTTTPIPSSTALVAVSVTSQVTTPEAGRHVHVADHQAVDRVAYSRAHFPHSLPVRVKFLRKYQHARRPSFRGQVTRWHLCLEETSRGSFSQWQIALTPGQYIFEDFGNAFTIVAQRHNEAPVLLSFPVSNSHVWVTQGIYQNNVP